MVKDRNYLTDRIRSLKSFLCIGLDPDLNKIPNPYRSSSEPLLRFCADVLEATIDLAIAYKINIAFFERQGSDGFRQLESLVKLIPKECFIIADAKRADIGNTSAQYAEYYFSKLNVDAITLHPYMGVDSLEPFLQFPDKWSIILALTSNAGGADFETLELKTKALVFEKVMERFNESKYSSKIMYVVGATQKDYMQAIRRVSPNNFLLIPGVGEQGGDLKNTIEELRNEVEGILINVSRGIIFPQIEDITKMSIRNAALHYSKQMQQLF